MSVALWYQIVLVFTLLSWPVIALAYDRWYAKRFVQLIVAFNAVLSSIFVASSRWPMYAGIEELATIRVLFMNADFWAHMGIVSCTLTMMSFGALVAAEAVLRLAGADEDPAALRPIHRLAMLAAVAASIPCPPFAAVLFMVASDKSVARRLGAADVPKYDLVPQDESRPLE